MKKKRLDQSRLNENINQDLPAKDRSVAVSIAPNQTTKPDSSISTPRQNLKTNTRDVMAVVFLQIIVLVFMIFLTLQYSWLHNVPHPLSPIFGSKDIGTFADSIASYNFVGVNSLEDKPSIFAVVLEVAIWSLAGVLARSEYYLSQIIVRKRQLFFWESVSKLISDSSMAVAIAIAVVLFLRATEFLELSLQDANVASIAAISFILGFYHEDTRRLLSSFRKRISETAEEAKENKEIE